MGRIHVAPSPLQAFNSVSHCLDSRAADTIVCRLLLLLLLLGHHGRTLLTLSMMGLGPWERHTEAYSRDRPVGEEKSETFRMHVLDMQQPSNDLSCWAGDGTTVTGSDGRSVFRNCPGSETVLAAFHTSHLVCFRGRGFITTPYRCKCQRVSHHRQAWPLKQRAKRRRENIIIQLRISFFRPSTTSSPTSITTHNAGYQHQDTLNPSLIDFIPCTRIGSWSGFLLSCPYSTLIR